MGVASVVPFLTLVGDPAAAGRLPYLATLRAASGLTDDRAFLMPRAGRRSLAILTTSLVNAGLTFAQLLLHEPHRLRPRPAPARPLPRPRAPVLREANSAELAKNVLSETDRLVVGVLTPATVIASRPSRRWPSSPS